MYVVKEIPLANNGLDKYVRILKNNNTQVELAGDQNYFYTIIRRLVNGEPQPYSDKENNISSEDLAIFLTNNNYDHFDYYVPSVGWETVLENTANLLKNCKEVFTTSKWVDTEKIELLKDEDFFKKFGFRPSKKPAFLNLIKEKAVKLLKEKGYRLTFDSSELPSYDTRSLTQAISFEKQGAYMKICQRDWRDHVTNYYLEINGRKEFELDTTDSPEEVAINVMVKKLEMLS